ncbi:MAG: sulfatase-like hydrolase/transferase, partial [Candidatus Omnitrophica bacterium]|nr:sulfatase-like hydrolase/transferase [Candidatus Omnitrophota bacterium]
RFLPLQRGFDDFYGFVNTGIDYWKHERYGIHSMYRNNQPTKEDYGTYCTYLFEREAIRFIRENRSRPFFCYVPFNAPHIASVLEKPKPVHAPKEFVDLYPEPKNEKEKHRRDYMAAVTCMDAAIGNILKTLEEIGQADNTIVIFFSDNGGSGRADNTPLRGGKSQMFEGGLRVPCIVRWPGVAPQNKVCEEFLTSLEIFPTLCRACGAKPPEDVVLDGFDMRSVLMGKEASSREDMFWERRGDRAARVGHWKWVDSARGSGLYDLSEDIGETRDLSNEKPEILQKIKNRFTAWKQEIERHEPRGPFRDY